MTERLIVGFDHVQVAIPPGGEAEARAFYVGLLGFEEVPKPAGLAARGGLWLVGPGLHLHLGVEDPFTPARKAHVALLVGDLAAARSALGAAAVPIAEDSTSVDVERCYVADPFGNRIELVAAADAGFTLRPARPDR